MTSTQQVLRALQGSHTAKRKIQANSPPTRVETFQLPDQAADPPLQHFRWTNQKCSRVAFSSCGQWAAACLKGKQECSLKGRARRQMKLPYRFTASKVVLYKTVSSFQQRASFCTGTSKLVIAWCQAAAHLCIAQRPRPRHRMSNTQKVSKPVSAALASQV